MKNNLSARLAALRRTGELQGSKTLNRTDNFHISLFPGQEEISETPAGPCYLRKLDLPLSTRHGNILLQDLLLYRGADLALPARDCSIREVDLNSCLFLDLETTGLAGGTGTWAFLIGAGWFTKNCFHLRQYFLRRPSEERAMLLHFTRAAAPYRCIITFNGKSFDLPLVQTRQVLTRTPALLQPQHHIDLLHCSRRLWKRRLQSCSLDTLEKSLLNVKRIDDIPGEEIPSVYFNYLRRGETFLLKKVFKHNVYDILSMVSLLTLMAQTADPDNEPEHSDDCFSLACLYEEEGYVEQAMRLFKKAAATADRSRPPGREALLRLSFLYKRKGRWEEAVQLWQGLAGPACDTPVPHVELAKYYEHRAGDCQKALTHTYQALQLTRRYSSHLKNSQCSPAALHHRASRLANKISTAKSKTKPSK